MLAVMPVKSGLRSYGGLLSKHFKMPKKEKCKENRNGYQEFFIQLFVGFIILVIEYSVFAK